MKPLLTALLGSSWRTSLIGYGQFFLISCIELFGSGETHWKHILLSAGAALYTRVSGDSAKIKEVKQILADQKKQVS